MGAARTAGRFGLAALAVAACALTACGAGGAGAPDLLPVEMPDLDAAHPSVRLQVQAARAALDEGGGARRPSGAPPTAGSACC